MGTLRTTIELTDKVSDRLQTINKNIGKTIGAMMKMNQTMTALQGGSLGKAVNSWSNTAQRAVKDLGMTQKEVAKMVHNHQKALDKQTEIEKSVSVKKRAAEEIAHINNATAKKIAGARAAAQIAVSNKKTENALTVEKQKQAYWQERINAKLQMQQVANQGIFAQMQAWASKLRNILTIYYAIRTVVQGIGKGVALSDKMTMTDAKFNLVAGGDKKLAGDLKEKTFFAAQRSTTDYLEFGKAVGKLGVLAGDKFKNQDSIVRFVELMNKSFQISGADTSERNAAMLQITQAIASNRLQGDEFRSILENAPMVMDALVKSLNIGHDKLKAMAKEGKITADVLIKAMFDAGTKIEEMYKQLPMTWERHWAKIKNVGVLAFEPIHRQLEKLFNSEKFKAFVDGLCTSMIVLGNLGGWALEKLASGFNKLAELGKVLGDMFISVAIAVGIVGIALAIVNWETTTFILVTAGLLLGLLALLVKFPQIILIIAGTIAIAQAAAGNMLYLVIFLIALVIYWIYRCSDSWADAIGRIVGAVCWLGSVLWDAIILVLAGILDYLDFWVNQAIRVAEVIYNTWTNGWTGWINGVKSVFGEFVSWIIGKIKPLVQLWDKMKGTNFTATLTATQEKFSNLGGSSYKKFKRVDMGGSLRSKALVNPMDAYDYGYKKGSGAVNSISKGLSNIGSKLDDLTKVDLNGQKLAAEALNGVNDKLGEGNDYGANTANNTGDIAKNTSSSQDYSYLRDWYWNKGLGNSIGYNIKIEQNNRNNVASGLDLDKIADALIDKFMEGLNIGKEGAKI